jgi:hypothetical protein
MRPFLGHAVHERKNAVGRGFAPPKQVEQLPGIHCDLIAAEPANAAHKASLPIVCRILDAEAMDTEQGGLRDFDALVPVVPIRGSGEKPAEVRIETPIDRGQKIDVRDRNAVHKSEVIFFESNDMSLMNGSGYRFKSGRMAEEE